MMYKLLYVWGFLISKVSDRALGYLSLCLAVLLYRVFRFRRRLLRANIARAFGADTPLKTLDQLALSSIQSLILTTLELIEGSHRNLATNVSLKDEGIVRDSLAAGRGCLIMCTHTANWEALAAGISQRICPAYVPVKPLGGASIDRYITDIRRAYGLHIVKRKQKGDSFAIIKQTLEKGHIVGFMQDQARPGSPKMPFFGDMAKTNVSMAAIWAKVQVPVIPCVARRLSPRKHEVQFYPPLDLVSTDNSDSDILKNAGIMNAKVESLIMANPSQFLWLHNRWK